MSEPSSTLVSRRLHLIAFAASLNLACSSATEAPDAPGGAAGMAAAGTVNGGAGAAGAAAGQAGSSGAGTSGGGGSTAGSPSTPQGGAMGGDTSVGGVPSAGSGGSAGAPAVVGCAWEVTEGRVSLFDGASLEQWESVNGGAAPWKVDAGQKTFEVVPLSGNIRTKVGFEDVCLHVEYLTPSYPSNVTGQERGNSGIYLKSAYEMQVLDSAGQPPASNTCGAIYGIQAPLVVACQGAPAWNTYEIEFQASEWNAGTKTKSARLVSATLNGELVQRDVELNPEGGATQAGVPDASGPQPLMLQDHDNGVKFRNVWLRVPK